ncbi:hypothetical protein [Gordonia tangerina]|uniref:Uncharacterized protein n=1 Tax=Gordonia tangerina TaxID=2911060 RepID=A0ABS9DGL9_9ACTN|nr:hypothetical protein [Gordonia tangerina]MCF3938380.1 hypothetical protein [Gordonia tangerina]
MTSVGERYREHVLARYPDADTDVLDEACRLLDEIDEAARRGAHELVIDGLMTRFNVCEFRLGMRVIH